MYIFYTTFKQFNQSGVELLRLHAFPMQFLLQEISRPVKKIVCLISQTLFAYIMEVKVFLCAEYCVPSMYIQKAREQSERKHWQKLRFKRH